MSLIDLEQCSCGILFPVPMIIDSSYKQHHANGKHNRARAVGICGLCYFVACGACEGSRGGSAWRCGCRHDYPKKVLLSRSEQVDATLLWGVWLALGCPSETNMD